MRALSLSSQLSASAQGKGKGPQQWPAASRAERVLPPSVGAMISPGHGRAFVECSAIGGGRPLGQKDDGRAPLWRLFVSLLVSLFYWKPLGRRSSRRLIKWRRVIRLGPPPTTSLADNWPATTTAPSWLPHADRAAAVAKVPRCKWALRAPHCRTLAALPVPPPFSPFFSLRARSSPGACGSLAAFAALGRPACDRARDSVARARRAHSLPPRAFLPLN